MPACIQEGRERASSPRHRPCLRNAHCASQGEAWGRRVPGACGAGAWTMSAPREVSAGVGRLKRCGLRDCRAPRALAPVAQARVGRGGCAGRSQLTVRTQGRIRASKTGAAASTPQVYSWRARGARHGAACSERRWYGMLADAPGRRRRQVRPSRRAGLARLCTPDTVSQRLICRGESAPKRTHLPPRSVRARHQPRAALLLGSLFAARGNAKLNASRLHAGTILIGSARSGSASPRGSARLARTGSLCQRPRKNAHRSSRM